MMPSDDWVNAKVQAYLKGLPDPLAENVAAVTLADRIQRRRNQGLRWRTFSAVAFIALAAWIPLPSQDRIPDLRAPPGVESVHSRQDLQHWRRIPADDTAVQDSAPLWI